MKISVNPMKNPLWERCFLLLFLIKKNIYFSINFVRFGTTKKATFRLWKPLECDWKAQNSILNAKTPSQTKKNLILKSHWLPTFVPVATLGGQSMLFLRFFWQINELIGFPVNDMSKLYVNWIPKNIIDKCLFIAQLLYHLYSQTTA